MRVIIMATIIIIVIALHDHSNSLLFPSLVWKQRFLPGEDQEGVGQVKRDLKSHGYRSALQGDSLEG